MKNSENSRLFAEKCYNNSEINSIAQTSLKRYFVRHTKSHAKRGSKDLFFLQRETDHPLRWYVVDSAFLQQAQISSSAPEMYSEIPNCRISLRLLLIKKSFYRHFRKFASYVCLQNFVFASKLKYVSDDDGVKNSPFHAFLRIILKFGVSHVRKVSLNSLIPLPKGPYC